MAPPPDAVGEVVLDADAIREDVLRLGAQITADYAGRRPHLVGVLKGAAVFVADLIRAIEVPTTLDFIAIVPYPEASRSGVVRIRKDLDDPIEGRDVIVVEGVCASGLSLAYLVRNFETRQPSSIRVCALLVKQRARPVELKLDYVGREIPDAFVVGYGLDAGERYRNLPYVARLP
jgi:hypoxanthine phosphoribosyltransferase